MKRFLAAALLACIFCSSLCGCSYGSADDSRVFTKGDMSLTLTWDFREEKTVDEWENYYAVYSSKHVIAYVQRIGFDEQPELRDVMSYGYMQALRQQYSEKDGKETVLVAADSKTPAFSYEMLQNGKSYTVLCCISKGDDAFWVMQFSCLTDGYDSRRDDMLQWAGSIRTSGTNEA